MKKILILCLIVALLMSATAFAYNNQEIEDSDTLSELAEEISKIAEEISDIIEMNKEKSITKVDKLTSDQEIEYSNTLSELAEEISDIIEMIKEKGITKVDKLTSDQEIKDSDTLSKETMFVTGVKGEYYKDHKDIPISIRYTYRRPSDGAIFTGNLLPYYLKAEKIDGEWWWQAFYEGTLTLQYYEY